MCSCFWPALPDYVRWSGGLVCEAVDRTGTVTLPRLLGVPLLLRSCAANLSGCADEVELDLRVLAAKVIWF